MKKEYKSAFCLQYTDDQYELKKWNSYYYQIQGQLHITHRNCCDFVVWTPSEAIDNLFVEQIYYDDSLWSNTIYASILYGINATWASQSSVCFWPSS